MSVENLAALILRYFKPSAKNFVNHAWITEINQILMNSKSEQPSYDFKQGFIELSGKNTFNNTCLEGVIQTCVAINNISPSATGYILIGVSDKESTTKRIRELYDVKGIDINGFSITGIDHEAELISGNLDDYFMSIKQKIASYNFTETLKQQILKDIQVCSYHGKHIIKISITSTGSICSFNDKFYIRQGSSTDIIDKAEGITALFSNYFK